MIRIHFPTTELGQYKRLYGLNHQCAYCGSWFNCGHRCCEKNHRTCQLCKTTGRPRVLYSRFHHKKKKPRALPPPLPRFIPLPPPPENWKDRVSERLLCAVADHLHFYRSDLRWWETLETLQDSIALVSGAIPPYMLR